MRSLAVEVQGNAAELQARFLANDPPIVGRTQNDRFTIEVPQGHLDDLGIVDGATIREQSGGCS